MRNLLPLIKEIFDILNISAEQFPAEGYYSESNELKNYFNYIKTLKTVNQKYKEKIKNNLGYVKIIDK